MYIIRKLQNSDQLFKFLNFGTVTEPVESGTGYVDSGDNFIRVTYTNYADFSNIGGVSILTKFTSLEVVLTGSAASGTVASVTNATTLALDAHAQLGTNGAPVNYVIYKKEIADFVPANVVHISEDDGGNWVLVYKDTTKTFTV